MANPNPNPTEVVEEEEADPLPPYDNMHLGHYFRNEREYNSMATTTPYSQRRVTASNSMDYMPVYDFRLTQARHEMDASDLPIRLSNIHWNSRHIGTQEFICCHMNLTRPPHPIVGQRLAETGALIPQHIGPPRFIRIAVISGRISMWKCICAYCRQTQADPEDNPNQHGANSLIAFSLPDQVSPTDQLTTAIHVWMLDCIFQFLNTAHVTGPSLYLPSYSPDRPIMRRCYALQNPPLYRGRLRQFRRYEVWYLYWTHTPYFLPNTPVWYVPPYNEYDRNPNRHFHTR